jgi:hypothetical protein
MPIIFVFDVLWKRSREPGSRQMLDAGTESG